NELHQRHIGQCQTARIETPTTLTARFVRLDRSDFECGRDSDRLRRLRQQNRRSQGADENQRSEFEHRHFSRSLFRSAFRLRRCAASADKKGGHYSCLFASPVSAPPVRLFWRNAAAPISPPIPIDSTALLGISISAPFSFRPSYSMFIARRCRATGLFWYALAASSKECAISCSACPRMMRACFSRDACASRDIASC